MLHLFYIITDIHCASRRACRSRAALSYEIEWESGKVGNSGALCCLINDMATSRRGNAAPRSGNGHRDERRAGRPECGGFPPFPARNAGAAVPTAAGTRRPRKPISAPGGRFSARRRTSIGPGAGARVSGAAVGATRASAPGRGFTWQLTSPRPAAPGACARRSASALFVRPSPRSGSGRDSREPCSRR